MVSRIFYVFQVFVVAAFLGSGAAFADEGSLHTHTTDIVCGGVHSQLISTYRYSTGLFQYVNSQEWIFDDKRVLIQQQGDKYFRVVSWACLPASGHEYVLLWFVNGGNCDECERLSIWDVRGNLVKDWKEFHVAYHEMKFPAKYGNEFSHQFHDVIYP